MTPRRLCRHWQDNKQVRPQSSQHRHQISQHRHRNKLQVREPKIPRVILEALSVVCCPWPFYLVSWLYLDYIATPNEITSHCPNFLLMQAPIMLHNHHRKFWMATNNLDIDLPTKPFVEITEFCVLTRQGIYHHPKGDPQLDTHRFRIEVWSVRSYLSQKMQPPLRVNLLVRLIGEVTDAEHLLRLERKSGN